MTTALCFDLDGTLVRFDEPYDEILSGVLDAHLGESGPAVIEAYQDAFFETFEALDPDPYEVGMAAAVGAAEGEADPAEMAAALLDAECEASSVEDAARESLRELGAEAQLGVVTNGVPEWQAAKLDHHGIADQFDAVVTSYEAGAHKPDAAPFDLARERLPADEYAMVGDDYEADVEGARAAGFVPIHFEVDESGDAPDFWATLKVMV